MVIAPSGKELDFRDLLDFGPIGNDPLGDPECDVACPSNQALVILPFTLPAAFPPLLAISMVMIMIVIVPRPARGR
jgi:hypothetical protein